MKSVADEMLKMFNTEVKKYKDEIKELKKENESLHKYIKIMTGNIVKDIVKECE